MSRYLISAIALASASWLAASAQAAQPAAPVANPLSAPDGQVAPPPPVAPGAEHVQGEAPQPRHRPRAQRAPRGTPPAPVVAQGPNGMPPPPPVGQGPNGMPPPPPGAHGPHGAPHAPHMRHGPVGQAVAAQTVAQGAVQRLLINPYGEVDGLRLADGTVVRFPPHMASALTGAVKPGDAVRIIGAVDGLRMVRADAVVNTASGQTVYDQPPALTDARPVPPHLRAQALQQQQVQGRIDLVLTGPQGEPNGVILTDGSIVRFPPDSVGLTLQPGAAFAASGMGTRNAMGTSLEAMSLGTSLSALQPLYDRAR